MLVFDCSHAIRQTPNLSLGWIAREAEKMHKQMGMLDAIEINWSSPETGESSRTRICATKVE